MRRLVPICLASALAAVPVVASAAVQASGATPSARPAHTLRLINGDTKPITSVYASPPGTKDWGDDLLGKQSAAAGKAVTLRFKDATPEACVRDLQMLMDDGKVVEKPGVDVCKTPELRFTR